MVLASSTFFVLTYHKSVGLALRGLIFGIELVLKQDFVSLSLLMILVDF